MGEKQALRVFKAVNVVFEGRMVTLEVSTVSSSLYVCVCMLTYICSTHLRSMNFVCSVVCLFIDSFIDSIFQWSANPVNDMFADAVVTVILKAESDTMPKKGQPRFIFHSFLL